MSDELLDVVLVCETNAIGDRSVSGPTPLQPDIPIAVMIDDGMVSMSAGVNRFWDLVFPKMGDDKQVWLKVAELSPLLLVERKLVVKSEEFVQFRKYWLTSKKKSFWYYFVDNWTDWCCKIARMQHFDNRIVIQFLCKKGSILSNTELGFKISQTVGKLLTMVEVCPR